MSDDGVCHPESARELLFAFRSVHGLNIGFQSSSEAVGIITGRDATFELHAFNDDMEPFRNAAFQLIPVHFRDAVENVLALHLKPNFALSLINNRVIFSNITVEDRLRNWDDVVFLIKEDVVGSDTFCLVTANSGHFLSINNEGDISVKSGISPGIDEVFVRDDESTYEHLLRLKDNGFTVLPVLTTESANEVRELIIRFQHYGNSNGYQVRIPDVGVYHPVFGEILVNMQVLAVVRRFLGRQARCATWSSNTLLPAMDHPVLGWHVDYPYHDIQDGPWPELPLGLQVLWMVDEFREDNGGTMFLPRSHEWLRQPDLEPFSRPAEATILTAAAGHVLIAHSAWWHRQTANTSPNPRAALLACFVRGFVIPKADVEEQYNRMAAQADYMSALDARQQLDLHRLLLGFHRRALRGVQA